MERRASKLKNVPQSEESSPTADAACTRCRGPRDREDRTKCAPCRAEATAVASERQREKRAANPNHAKEHSALYRARRKAASPIGRAQPRITYGLTNEELHQLFENQEGLCAVCSKPICFECPLLHKCPKRMHIDHDHKTDEVRGLLCRHCNQGLGHFMDSTTYLRNAAGYLEACV